MSASTFFRANLHRASAWFEVLTTSAHSQTAAMTLAPGQATGEEPEAHDASEQTLLLVSGQLAGQVGGAHVTLGAGDFVVIAPGTPHRFSNPGTEPAVTFSVYCPPEYAPDEKG